MFPPGTMGPGSPAFSKPLSVLDAVAGATLYDFMIHSNGAAFNDIFAMTRTPVWNTVYADRFFFFVQRWHFWVNLYSVSQPDTCIYNSNTPPTAAPTAGSKSSSAGDNIILIVVLCVALVVVLAGLRHMHSRHQKVETVNNYHALENTTGYAA